MKARFRGVVIVVVALLAIGGALMLGNIQVTSSKSVRLTAVVGNEFGRPELVKSRQDLFGSDPLEKQTALDIKLNFTPKATKERINEGVTITGSLSSGIGSMPVQLSGDLEMVKNANGHEFSSGVVDGAAKVNGKDIPATVFISAIPDENKYVLTIALQPTSGTAAVLAFGSPFEEYSAKFQAQAPV